MKETIKIEFEELAKSVTAHVKIECEQEILTRDMEPHKEYHDNLLEETQRLFIEAQKFAHKKTLEKNMN